MSAENQTLMNDNKQLNALIKEYEQTLENVMATFRNRAVRFSTLIPLVFHPDLTNSCLVRGDGFSPPSTQNEVQQRELALIREYEHKLLVRETEELVRALSASSSLSTSLGRLGSLLRSVMRTLNGEEDAQFLTGTDEHGMKVSNSQSSM